MCLINNVYGLIFRNTYFFAPAKINPANSTARLSWAFLEEPEPKPLKIIIDSRSRSRSRESSLFRQIWSRSRLKKFMKTAPRSRKPGFFRGSRWKMVPAPKHCTLVQIYGFCPTIIFHPFLGRFWCQIRQIRGFWGRGILF